MMHLSQTAASDTISCVLQAAQEVFCDAGFRASVDAVATRAGVARQTIYNNFSNKRNLFSKAIENSVNGILIELTPCQHDDMQTQLEEFGRRFRQKALTLEAARLHCILTMEARRFPEEAKDFFDKACISPRRHLARMLASYMQQDLLRTDDPLEAAHFFFDTLISIDMDRLHFGGALPDPNLEMDCVRRRVDRFLRAYALVGD